MRVAFHGWPGNDETIDTVMFDPNQKPDTARAENSIFGSPEADNLLPKDEFPDYAMRAEDAFQLVSDELMPARILQPSARPGMKSRSGC